jgi:spore coat protein U-like protein
MKPQSIQLKSILWLGCLAMLAFATSAQARITCTPSAATFATAYPMTGGALNITAGSFTVTCTSNKAAARTATYQVSANNGLNVSGTQRRARVGVTPSYLNYNLTSNSGCTTAWNTTTLIPTPAYTTPVITSATSDTHTFFFWGCVPAGLTVPAAGNYTDTITMTVTGSASAGGFTGGAGSITVSITAPATCTISTAGTAITFSYTSRQATTASASTTFNTTCTLNLPYSLSLDAGGTGYTGSFTTPTGTYTNTATTLIYTLTLPAATKGTGAAQPYTLTGSMAASQGGKCNAATCSVTDIHTLTVTY